MNDDGSIGQASAAVAMANDAIDKARRAAASSRSRRTQERARVGKALDRTGAAADLDLKHNDNAYHVIATMISERLQPKLGANPGSTHYTITVEDTAFFQKMLPVNARKSFVDAVRYRSQLLKSGVGSKEATTGRLTMQCQMLGLDRDSANVLLELNESAGMSYPINFKGQGPVALSPDNLIANIHQYNKGQQSYNVDPPGDNGVNFGLSSPMATFSPTNMGGAPAESLARQQILAEIQETKFLMKGSVTPDATEFWQKHLEELNQRLAALDEEEMPKGVGNFVSGHVGYSGSVVGGFGDDIDPYNKVNTRYKAPSIAPHEGYMEANHRTEMGMGDMANPQGDSLVEAPVGAMAAGIRREPDELPVCDVVAPSDLPGGYMFEAQLGSKKFLATVPPGGVTKGQRFVSTMRELETIEIPIPLGAWRDGIKDCFSDGMCHPLFLNALFLPCIALGQIMTRAGLDWQGEPTNKLVSGQTCANMTVFLVFWLAINASAGFLLFVAYLRREDAYYEGGEHYAYAVLVLFNIFVALYLVNLTKKVRSSIRNKYQIPEGSCACEGTEDCLCATFCTPCTICQMGRHTADFDTYRATCCTSTGLPRQVELAPVTFYEDQYEAMDGGQMM